MSLTKATYSMISGAVTNVLDYGATGDGITDDTDAIQNAISAASSTTGHVYFPSGTYIVSDTLCNDVRIVIEGAHRYTTIIDCGDFTGTIFRVSPDSAIKNLKLQGNVGNRDAVGISTNDLLVRCVIQDVDFENLDYAINTNNLDCFSTQINRVTANYVTGAFHLSGFNGGNITSVYITNFDEDAIFIQNCKSIVITSLITEFGGLSALHLQGVYDLHLEGIYTEGNWSHPSGTSRIFNFEQKSGPGPSRSISVNNAYLGSYHDIAGIPAVPIALFGVTGVEFNNVTWFETLNTKIDYFIDTTPYPGNESPVKVTNWTRVIGDTDIPIADNNYYVTTDGTFSAGFLTTPDTNGIYPKQTAYTTTGIWTPVLGGSGGTSGQTYVTQKGFYTQIGNVVTATFQIELSAKGTITGDVQIQGLPVKTLYDSTYRSAGNIGYFANFSSVLNLSLLVPNYSNSVTLLHMETAGSGPTAATTTQITNTSRIDGTIVYITD